MARIFNLTNLKLMKESEYINLHISLPRRVTETFTEEVATGFLFKTSTIVTDQRNISNENGITTGNIPFQLLSPFHRRLSEYSMQPKTAKNT